MNKQLNPSVSPRLNTFKTALRAFAIVTALSLGTALASAQTDMQTNSATGMTNGLSMADQKFMTNAAEGGMLEVKLGQLAAQQATRDDVKSFAQKMVTDHTQINDDLKSLASQKNQPLPDMLDAKHQKIYEKQAALSGPDFDTAYISLMVKAHKMDARLFKKEADTSDMDIKNFVNKSLPIIEEHLNMVEGMNK